MKLSVIISNRNDIVPLNITINSCIEAFKSLTCKAEIVICDNSDTSHHKLLSVAIPNGWVKSKLVKVINQNRPCFTSARMNAAEVATGEYIFCVDSHVLFGFNTLKDSVAFMDSKADDPNLGFGHPPIRWAHQGPAAIKHTLKVSPHGLPNGGWDGSYTVQRKMYWKFMPWICRRDWYLNILKGYGTHANAMLSWGGAEALQQVKSLMLGYDNWAIITDPIIHIGPYTPDVIALGQYKYRTYTANGNYPHGFGVLVANAVLAGNELGYELSKLGEEQFTNRHNIKVDDYWNKAVGLAKAEHEWLMDVKKYSYQELITKKPWEVS
jgi:hypothetical protein